MIINGEAPANVSYEDVCVCVYVCVAERVYLSPFLIVTATHQKASSSYKHTSKCAASLVYFRSRPSVMGYNC